MSRAAASHRSTRGANIRPWSGTPPTNASRRPARSAGAYRANCRPISRPRASMARAMRPVAWASPSARRSSSNTCQYISARFLNAAYSSPRRRSASAISGPLDHVDMRQHVEVDIALDHGLAALVLLETSHGRFGRRPSSDPGDGDVAGVGLKNLFGLRVVDHALLRIARVASGLQLFVERVVDPRLALALGLLAVEGVEVFVVRVGIVHEPADPHELVVVLPEAGAEHALLQDLELGLHVEVLEQHRLNGLGERLAAIAFVTHRQRDLRPVAPALERRALELCHRCFRVEALDVPDLLVVDRAREAGRDHRMGGNGEAIGDSDDVL